nr:GntR family transcriptional regulator [Amycolatopsis umgeniensis]
MADGVYERLRALIMNHGIAPGDRVNIDEIARELDVSGTPVREALARLESEGLVSRLPLRGYRVTELLTARELTDLYELRLLLEPVSAAKAAARMTTKAAQELRAELRTCPTAPVGDSYETYRALTSHDDRLHTRILRLAGNTAVEQAFARTHCHLHVFRLSYDRPFGVQTIEEHRAIVVALIAADPEAASAAMVHHLETARDRLLSRY